MIYTDSHTHELAQLLLTFQTTCISGNYVWIWRALEFQVMLSIKMSSMVFGFWPVCLNLGRDTSSKL
ncbi:hypothetical protein HanIR_Chr04g0175111 [Helianthus annuus]|nr:hypothetical protein HanIR_Chr04g0175111 [Helianthus annuus]